MKVLLIEDHKETAQTIKDELQDRYIMDMAYTGEEGEALAEMYDYDLIILDLMLPDKNGIEICNKLRRNGIKTPILMLTGKDEIAKKVSAFDAGADDYLTKPFSFQELKARMRALIRRRYNDSTTNVINIDDLSIDTEKKQVRRGNKVIFLRRKEYDLLEYFIRNAGRVITREMILNHVWDNAFEAFTNTVDVHIKYLRDQVDKPFSKKLIKTIHGVGYKLEA